MTLTVLSYSQNFLSFYLYSFLLSLSLPFPFLFFYVSEFSSTQSCFACSIFILFIPSNSLSSFLWLFMSTLFLYLILSRFLSRSDEAFSCNEFVLSFSHQARPFPWETKRFQKMFYLQTSTWNFFDNAGNKKESACGVCVFVCVREKKERVREGERLRETEWERQEEV